MLKINGILYFKLLNSLHTKFPFTFGKDLSNSSLKYVGFNIINNNK